MTTPTVTEIKSSRIDNDTTNYVDVTPTAAGLENLQKWVCYTARNSIETAFEDYKNVETFRHGIDGIIALEVKANVSGCENIHVMTVIGFDDVGDLVIECWERWDDETHKTHSVDHAVDRITMLIEQELARYSHFWDDEEMCDDMFETFIEDVFAVIE